jgi:hypothetical protein
MKMLRRTFAALLIALTVLPFTAPFPTCDLSALFDSTASHPASSVSAADDASHAVALAAASTRIVSRIKATAHAQAPASFSQMMREAFCHATRSSATPPPDCTSFASLRI